MSDMYVGHESLRQDVGKTKLFILNYCLRQIIENIVVYKYTRSMKANFTKTKLFSHVDIVIDKCNINAVKKFECLRNL